jgi:ribulose 1,5-bisphosphate carboxylase large subunit-like protein
VKRAGAKAVREALEALCRALGELPADALDQASFRAYGRAVDVLDPDEFGERFKAQAKQFAGRGK